MHRPRQWGHDQRHPARRGQALLQPEEPVAANRGELQHAQPPPQKIEGIRRPQDRPVH
eukprot:CAMPEP_0182882256 /NCGR_PEP_ID=MMETSP0034_2-20130328/17675_1 /TAXON_ID=156128 /ORGANISM="Nephroselmis pyriformis, Strain CCMP717" /LENGTH=57 /DNA_ID=CAMNT_0025015341 /DNA_START=155 /DNA_END=325 /DNA_ORIENTATION=+